MEGVLEKAHAESFPFYVGLGESLGSANWANTNANADTNANAKPSVCEIGGEA